MLDAEPRQEVVSAIAGWGHALPERIVDNAHFASYLDTSDEWIRSRTGIVQRHWAQKDESASTLAAPACEQALARAGISADEVDAIVLATVTPDYQFPSTACFLQNLLGCSNAFCFDVNAVCSGFMYALTTADALIAARRAECVLVVGVDIYSRIIDPNDRRTCILFGDGAGAVVLKRSKTDSGIVRMELGSDGSHTDILCVPRGTAKEVSPESLAQGQHYLQMEGREVFKLAVRRLIDVSTSVVENSGHQIADVDYVVSHQANKRILDSMAKSMGLEDNKILSNVDRVGNTSAASIPILLSEALSADTISKGDLVLLSAFGGGVTWGAGLVRL